MRAGGPGTGARANAGLRAARTRSSGAGNVAFAWRPRPRAALGQWRPAATSGRGRCGRLVGRPRRAEGQTPWRLRDPLARVAARHFQSFWESRGGIRPQLLRRGPSPAGAALRSRPEAASRPHSRRYPGVLCQQAPEPSPLSQRLQPRMCWRFIIDGVLSRNEGEKVSRTRASPAAELHEETVPAPGRLASSSLCKSSLSPRCRLCIRRQHCLVSEN